MHSRLDGRRFGLGRDRMGGDFGGRWRKRLHHLAGKAPGESASSPQRQAQRRRTGQAWSRRTNSVDVGVGHLETTLMPAGRSQLGHGSPARHMPWCRRAPGPMPTGRLAGVRSLPRGRPPTSSGFAGPARWSPDRRRSGGKLRPTGERGLQRGPETRHRIALKRWGSGGWIGGRQRRSWCSRRRWSAA